MTPWQPSFEKFIKKFHEEICGNSQVIVNVHYDYYVDSTSGIATFPMEPQSTGDKFSNGADLSKWLAWCMSVQIFPNIDLIKDGNLSTKIEEIDYPWLYDGRHLYRKDYPQEVFQHIEANLELHPFFCGF